MFVFPTYSISLFIFIHKYTTSTSPHDNWGGTEWWMAKGPRRAQWVQLYLTCMYILFNIGSFSVSLCYKWLMNLFPVSVTQHYSRPLNHISSTPPSSAINQNHEKCPSQREWPRLHMLHSLLENLLAFITILLIDSCWKKNIFPLYCAHMSLL